MKPCFLYAALVAFFSLVAMPTLAASPLGNVGTATVDAGALSIENRLGFTRDNTSRTANQRFRSRQHVDYGFNDTHAIRFVVEQDKLHGDNLEHRGFTLEHRMQFVERRTAGWDGGIRLTYTHRDNDKRPNSVGLRLMSQVPFAQLWEWRQNMIFGRTVGPEAVAGTSIEWRNGVLRNMGAAPEYGVKKWQLGVEAFNDFGNLRQLHGYSEQDHEIGPVLKASFDNGVYVQTGYRFAISKAAPNHSMKLFTGIAF